MRKTDAPGNVGNQFVDYDEATSTPGTIVEADWLNDVQAELIGIQNDQSIAEAAGSNNYVLAAIKGIAIQQSKRLGEIFQLEEHVDPAEFDKDDPESFFPAVDLTAIDGHEDIDDANYPLLGPYLRAKYFKYAEGLASEKTQFDVTDYDITSGTFTLTFADTTPENTILSALLEDKVIHGSYTDFRSINLPNAIGGLSAGTYAITEIDTLNRTVKGTTADGDASGSVTAVAQFPKHAIPGSSTTARLFEVKGRSTVASNDSDGHYIAGLRRRDQMQRITGTSPLLWFFGAGETGSISRLSGSATRPGSGSLGIDGNILFDSSDSPDARTSSTTDGPTEPRGLSVHMYMWAKNYVA